MNDEGTRPQLESLLTAAVDHTRPAPADAVAHWAGKLPPLLLDIWRRYGMVRLAGGRLRLVDPRRFTPLMEYIFEGDPDLDGDTHAIALGDFGELVLWSERYGFGFLTPMLSALDMPYILTATAPSADSQIADLLVPIKATGIEVFDTDLQPLHDRLRARLGPLEDDLIYAATPVPLPPEGTSEEDYLVADALEWLEAVYVEVHVTLMEWEPEMRQLRLIGQPWPPGLSAGRRKIQL